MRATSAFLAVLVALFTGAEARAVTLDPDGAIRPALLGAALDALETHADAIIAERTIVIVDYGLPSPTPRLHVLDLKTGAVVSYRAAHGRGSDPDHDGRLDTFSSAPGSSASPEGAFRIAERYTGKHGASQRLDGLDPGNANARARAIVLHAAAYAEPDFLAAHGKLGRSHGCIVLSDADLTAIFDTVPPGAFLFVGR